MRRSILTIPFAIALLALTGCVSSAYPAFERPATDEDVLPSGIEPPDVPGVDLSSSRFAGTHDDFGYYMFRFDSGYCLTVDAGARSSSSCGGPSGVTTSAPGVYEAKLRPEGTPLDDGWIALNENVSVNQSP